MAKFEIPQAPLREKRCENCAAFDAFAKQCRANYPIAVPVGGPGGTLGAASIFPPAKAEDWCMKWEAVLM